MSLTYRCISLVPTTTPSSRPAHALTNKFAEGCTAAARPASIVSLSSPVFAVKSGSSSQVGPLNFSMTIRHSDNLSFLEVSGRLTSFESTAFRDAIHGMLNQGHKNIVLNLTALDYLDSSGVGELVRNYVAVVKKGGAMRVVGLAPKIEEILKVTHLHQVFPDFPDEASARASLSPGNNK
jgi:anti-sigma B factor antagonist